jgi:hypothetical protein
MWEEGEEESIINEKTDELGEEIEVGPTSIDVTDEQPSTVEAPPIAEQQEEVQEQNKQIEAQEESEISKRKKKRRMTSYLSNISKQVEKHGNQINKLVLMIQSLQKQKQTKTIVEAGIGKLQFQSLKQIKSQVNQLQSQVTRIQDDVRRIQTAPL